MEKEIIDPHSNQIVSISEQPDVVANVFNQFFISIPRKTLSSAYGDDFKVKTTEPQAHTAIWLLKKIGKSEIEEALNKIKNPTSAGFDGITLNMITNNAEIFRNLLVRLFNFSISNGYFPTCLKKTIVITIF